MYRPSESIAIHAAPNEPPLVLAVSHKHMVSSPSRVKRPWVAPAIRTLPFSETLPPGVIREWSRVDAETTKVTGVHST